MRSVFFKDTYTHQRTQLTIVTNIIEREFVATAIVLYFHILRCWAFYAPRHHKNGGCQIRTTHDVRPHKSLQSTGMLLLPCLMMYYIFSVLFQLFVWCHCMAFNNNVSVQYNGELLPGIILLPQCYYHRGTRLNAMKRFCICSLRSHLNVLTFFPLTGGCSEGHLPIHSGHQVRWTYSRGHTGGRSHRIFHPPSFCGACLNFSREKDSAVSFPRRP